MLHMAKYLQNIYKVSLWRGRRGREGSCTDSCCPPFNIIVVWMYILIAEMSLVWLAIQKPWGNQSPWLPCGVGETSGYSICKGNDVGSYGVVGTEALLGG